MRRCSITIGCGSPQKSRLMVLCAVLGVGFSTLASLSAQSLTWLGTLGGYSSAAYDVSADGRVVVGGDSPQSELPKAFRWENSVMQRVFDLGEAYGTSASGSVVVGRGLGENDLYFHALLWSNGVVVDLGTLGDPSSLSWANDVSADGEVVVGWAENSSYQPRAFRWAGGVMQDLGTLYDWCCSVAYGVSADGTVVVGKAQSFSGDQHAFRWTVSTGMQDLGTLEGASVAYGVSADGRIVVGAYDEAYITRAFRWIEGQGMEDLNTTYAELLSEGSSLEVAYAISPDGRYIVGEGYNASMMRYEAFLLDTGSQCQNHNGDVDNNGCVDDADLLAVLFAFGSSGSNLGRVDVNCDEMVDDADLLTVLFNFGQGC